MGFRKFNSTDRKGRGPKAQRYNRESSLEVTEQVIWKTRFKEEAQRKDTGSVYIKKTLTSNLEWCVQAQSSPILCNPMHCSPPGSSVHGLFQATILEWVAISFSRYVLVLNHIMLRILLQPETVFTQAYHCGIILTIEPNFESESESESRSVVSDSLRPHGL